MGWLLGKKYEKRRYREKYEKGGREKRQKLHRKSKNEVKCLTIASLWGLISPRPLHLCTSRKKILKSHRWWPVGVGGAIEMHNK